MLRSLSVLLVLMLAALPAHALRPVAWTAALVGETLVHPGARVGAEFTLVEAGAFECRAALNAGGWWHRGFHTALMVDADAGCRHHFGALYVEARAGAGYLHTLLAGTTYERTEEGFRAVPLASRGGFMPTVGVGAGYDLSRAGGWPVALFGRLAAFGQAPFNGGLALHPALVVGVEWRVQGGAR